MDCIVISFRVIETFPAFFLNRRISLASLSLDVQLQTISSTDKEIEDRIAEMVIDIRNKMIFGGELIELNSKMNVILPEGKVQPCASGIVRIFGATNYGKKCQAVGITRIIEDVHAESMDIDFCSIIGIDEYILSLYKKAKWSKVDDISNYEIFNSTAKRAPYQSWEDNLNKSRMFHLIRMSLYNDLHEYYLLKFENGEIFICKLEELLAEGKEERRVILGLPLVSAYSGHYQRANICFLSLPGCALCICSYYESEQMLDCQHRFQGQIKNQKNEVSAK